jgi:Pectate lyase superfamily protein
MAGLRLPRLTFAGRYLVPISAAAAFLVSLLCWMTALGLRRHYMLGHSFDYDVREYGAKGNGLASDTAALQAAINAAAAQGGGVVILPPGRYLSGTLHLRSNVSLRLCGGAVLIASRDDADFDPYETPPPGSLNRQR